MADAARAGAAIYTKPILSIYDLGVIRLSNQLAWQCPARLIIDFYTEHISANHLDVGVGTGYYLDKCRFPTNSPRLALMDLNPNSLETASKRLERYTPTNHLANVLEPLAWNTAPFDSIGLGYLLHCLPGTMLSKQTVFMYLKPLLKPGGVIFGTTILGQGVPANSLARMLMHVYNAKGIFSNRDDSFDTLNEALDTHFRDYTVEVVGCVALFSGTVPDIRR